MEEQKIKSILEASYFEESKVIPLKPLVKIDDSIILSEKSILTIGGLPKARKSTFMFGLIASILSQQKVFNFSGAAGKILLADTEQTSYDFQKHLSGLKKLTGSSELVGLNSFLFRQYDVNEVRDVIPYALERIKPQYLFLDSVTDLVYNVNDFEEVRKFTQWLKFVSVECNVSIICLVHLSKTNNFTLGALGSSLDRVSQSTLIVKKDKDSGCSFLEPQYLRSSEDFKPIGIYWNKESEKYELTDTQAKDTKKKFSMNEFTKQEIINRCDIIFMNEKTLTYAALVDKVKQFFGVGNTYARQTVIPYLIGNKFIFNKGSNYTQY